MPKLSKLPWPIKRKEQTLKADFNPSQRTLRKMADRKAKASTKKLHPKIQMQVKL
jgi:hypothetical protein